MTAPATVTVVKTAGLFSGKSACLANKPLFLRYPWTPAVGLPNHGARSSVAQSLAPLETKISRRFHTRNRSSRCDTSCDASVFRRRRRSARYSSAYMSSAESSPLFDTNASCAGGVHHGPGRADPTQGVVNLLAAVSLMLATAELDRLAVRAGVASEKCSNPYQSEGQAPSSDRSPGHTVPPNTPAPREMSGVEVFQFN